MDITNKEWIDPKYINELTVLFGFISFILPWNMVYSNLPEIQTRLINFRFPLFEIVYGTGAIQESSIDILFIIESYSLQSGQSAQIAYTVWIIASTVLTLSLIYSVLLYFKEETIVNKSPYNPPTIVGTLLLVSAVSFTASMVLQIMYGLPGIQIPIGVAILFCFSFILLTNKKEE